MRFIAPSDFSQGLRNPLKIPGGAMHVKTGTIFSIGGNTPTEQLEGEDLETYRTFFGAGCLCPLDSERGRQILADVRKVEEKAKQSIPKPKTDWARAAVWIALATLLAMVIIYFLS